MIRVAEFMPDRPLYQGGAGEALNVVPRSHSYSPLAALANFSTNALLTRAQGAASFRSAGNVVSFYAGDASKLYRLNTSNAWVDASAAIFRTGSDQQWNFCQFGQLAVAVNGADVPQKNTIGAVTNFSTLGGNPPVAKYAVPVRDFLFLGNLQSDPQAVQWSAINNPEAWVIGQSQADIQSMPDGGWVQGMVGGEFAIVFSEFAINRFTYAGSAVIFQRDQIATNIGASIPGSIAGFSDRAFFVHRTGFYTIVGGQLVQPIGAERVDNYFWTNLNTSFAHRVTSSIDPERALYVVSFPNTASADGTPNEWMIYNWVVDRWSHALPGNHEIIYSSLSSQQWSLEQIGAVYPRLDNVPYSLDSGVWSGIGRLLLGAFDANHYGAYANGGTLPATVDASEVNIVEGKRGLLGRVRPLVEGKAVNVTVGVGTRDRLDLAPRWLNAVSLEPNGSAIFRANSRYHRIRMSTDPGALWTHILGVDIEQMQGAGTR
ncbi:MAG TPA: hypothetical protein VHL08_04590 [Dongiaceae bacterium]|jgi:hypothetical protein|nr:hypothetical protein [Dongiaceae bacterium]